MNEWTDGWCSCVIETRGAIDDRRARGDAADRLWLEALKTAEERVVSIGAWKWDDVEELSAAQKDTKEEMQEIAISDADKAFIESTKKTIVAARAGGDK